MTALQKRLSEIEARLAAATPGPWTIKPHPVHRGYRQVSRVDTNDYIFVFNSQPENATLIAAAPTDLADMCKALRLALDALDKYAAEEEMIFKRNYISPPFVNCMRATKAREAIDAVLGGSQPKEDK